jgi:hypothetical protein
VTNMRPSGKNATDHGFSSPVTKVARRKACFSEVMTEDRSCAHEGIKPAKLKSKMMRPRKI